MQMSTSRRPEADSCRVGNKAAASATGGDLLLISKLLDLHGVGQGAFVVFRQKSIFCSENSICFPFDSENLYNFVFI